MAEPIVGGAEAPLEVRPVSSDIARRRASRDLWVSRGHLWAAAAAALALAAFTFAGGVTLGKRWATPVAAPTPSLTAEVPRDELLRLLARIDGNAAGPAAALTFPDALRGQPTGPGGVPAETPPAPTVVAGGPAAVGGDPVGAGGFTVVLSTTSDEAAARALQARLQAAGIQGMVATELVEGAPRYRLAVGRHARREDAVEAARWLSAAGDAVVEPLLPPAAPLPEPTPEPEAPAPE